MTRNVFLGIAGAALALSLSGCVATSGEMGNLRDDLHQLQLTLNELQHNQADLSAKMDTLGTDLGPLNAQLQETQNRMSLLGQRLDDLESNIGQRLTKITDNLPEAKISVTPAPSEIYRMAYSDFSRGKYDVAVTGFQSYLDKYPQGELGDQAQYYLGECYYSQNRWDEALIEFTKIEKNYPASASVPAARLKRALCLELTGKVKDGETLLKSVVKDFPTSAEAFTAQEKLKSYSKTDDQ